MTERYHRVYGRGYDAGTQDATLAVRDALAAGFQLAARDDFSHDTVSVRSPDKSEIVMVSNVVALAGVVRRWIAKERK